MKYKICPLCAAHLDHGERCNCKLVTETTMVKPQEYTRQDPPEEVYSPPPFSMEEWERYCNGTLDPPALQG